MALLSTRRGGDRAAVRRLEAPVYASCAFLCGVVAFALLAVSVWVQWHGDRAAAGLAWSSGALVAVGCAVAAWRVADRSFSATLRAQVDRFDALLQAVPDGVVATTGDGTVVLANDRADSLLGYPPGTLAGASIAGLWPTGGPDAHTTGPLSAHTIARRDGTEFVADVRLGSVPHGGSRIALAFIRDVTDQRMASDDLARVRAELETEMQERRRMRAVSELLQALRSREEARSVLNLHLEHLFPGTSGAVLLFEPARERIENLVDWGPDASAHESFHLEACWATRLGRPHSGELGGAAAPCPHVGRLGEAESLCVPLLADGETLGVFHIRSSAAPSGTGAEPAPPERLTQAVRRRVMAVAERLAPPLANLRLREQLRDQTIRDGLTGAFNRRYLEEALGRELGRSARGGGYPIGVVMIDLDHFKRVNDTFGHRVGDQVLRSFATFLMRGVRVDDIVCRYGGEEFVVILPGSTVAATMTRVETLREAWEAMSAQQRTGDRPPTTFSAGVAAGPIDGASTDRLLEAADRALYQAKSNGRNCVVAVQGIRIPLTPDS